MEIELDRRLFYALLATIALLAVVGLAALGRPYTPDPARVIGRADWVALQAERRYQEELAHLQQDLAELAGLLQARPDPVRAEMAASRIAQRHVDGLALLARQREAVVIAAQVVRDWAAGYATYEEAVATVNEAIAIVGESQEPEVLEEETENDEWGADYDD